ncbi:MAG: PAS domain S-box protein [Deltaproteobacteria bacterium]|nr:PAS domain S-box protein [Deltaproteobacteria bacterium]MBW2019079.1 PAS domain S-box protein [Deltaproteobacteria bacterium]MBW2073530.1 PAS domain S-box protein [Deltaproteobacteria bacterium]
MKKYFEYFARKPGLRLVSVVILVLLVGVFFLGMLSAREMKRMISEDFNVQQLALAKHAAGILTQNFQIIKRELLALSLSPSIQYVEAVSWANRMKISLSSVGDYGVFRIMLINADGAQAYCMNYNYAIFTEVNAYGDSPCFKWCKKPENKNKIYMSNAGEGIVENSEPGLIMKMCTPVYQISFDEAHPKPTQKFSGVLVFVLDAGSLAEKFVSPIRSGKTGYGWVIDESGNFLYHPERDFIGQNAFEVRKFKDPRISFSKINLIQKTKMLQGGEGTSWYISGWHRGVTGIVKKLIAYAPVHIGAANASRIWSVAVVAPISEVEDAIHTVYVRQMMIQGAVAATVFVIFAFLIGNERAWLRTLKQEVEEKTKDLARYAERLRRSEEMYRSLVESADDLIFTIDKDCNVFSINEYSRKLIGKRSEDIIGKNIGDFIEYESDDGTPSIVAKIFETSESISREERVKIRGKEYWLDTKYKAVGTDQGEVNAVLVISRDITEHKTIEEQLFHTEKLASLGSLSAGVAHEINNPIAIILGFTELLLEKAPEGSKEYEILKTIERQGYNCKRVVDNLLTFARIPEKATKKTDVVEDLQKVVNVVMNTLVTKKVDLKTDIEEDLPKVRGDGQQLEQVFLNIINNAVAAMDGGGVLTIVAHRSNDMVSISFTDTGHGIPPENMDKIFEPFFTTKKVGEGTGLGLSVSYGIAKKFGGDIIVKSQTKAEGKEPGTTFTVLLPIVEK